mmetsp:Transcript_59166/g.190311  ORF Transcript_59166/g.190311 Transcript_59166/m.190311 type:complete len:221 (+) Transcript_59166:2044-2706(+)
MGGAQVCLQPGVVDLDAPKGTKVVAVLVDDGDALDLLGQVVYCQGGAALALHPAGRRLVEGEAAAQRAYLAQPHSVDPRQGRQHHADAHAHGHRGVRLPLVQGHAASLQGGEAAGGVRVELHAGAVHAEDEGEAVGHDGARLASACRALLATTRLLGPLVDHRPLGEVAAHVDRRERRQEVLDRPPRVRERDVANLHDLALHGVHALSLGWGDTEELGIK